MASAPCAVPTHIQTQQMWATWMDEGLSRASLQVVRVHIKQAALQELGGAELDKPHPEKQATEVLGEKKGS